MTKHWAWVALSGNQHAEINADLNNEEEADDTDCIILDHPSHSSGVPVELDAEPATPILRAAFNRMNAARSSHELMPPPPPPSERPLKVPLPPLPHEAIPRNPADLDPVDRAKIQARIDAIRFLEMVWIYFLLACMYYRI